MVDKQCSRCGFYDTDFECTCPSCDKWYACPLEPEPKPEEFMIKTEALIYKAKSKYPANFHYKGRLTEEELSKIEKKCDVKCSSVYTDGSAMYCIRYIDKEILQ